MTSHLGHCGVCCTPEQWAYVSDMQQFCRKQVVAQQSDQGKEGAMRIAVACDHAGFLLKGPVLDELAQTGVETLDLGVDSPTAVDFPDYAERVGRAMQQ